MSHLHKVLSVAAIAVCVGAAPAAAAATQYTVGTFVPSSAGTTVAGLLTQELPVPSASLTTQATAMVPLSGRGRYALTGEVRSPGNLHVGIGAGVGKLERDGKSGFLFSGLAGVPIAERLSLTGRFYQGVTQPVGTGGMLGLQFGV